MDQHPSPIARLSRELGNSGTKEILPPTERNLKMLSEGKLEELVTELGDLLDNVVEAGEGRYEFGWQDYQRIERTGDKALALISALRALRAERDDLARKVFVPGLRRCAKCELKLISSSLNVADGAVTAKNDPQDCPNGCGPLWPVTEREAGNDACDRLDTAADTIKALEAELAALRAQAPAPVEPIGYAERLFGRAIERLSVPGARNGVSSIDVTFADGSTVHVEGSSVDEAWQRLADAAKALASLSPDPTEGGEQ